MTKHAGRPGWLKLDNAAKIYPPSASRRWQSMFRLSVTLTEDVDPALLARAQERTLARMPSFACRLRRGLFWYYLEQLDGAPPVQEDTRNPMRPLDARANRRFMYRLLYRNADGRGRIAVEFFHALCDGTGGMTFLMTLANEYLRLAHGIDVSPAKYILSCDDAPRPEEMEDAFPRYAGSVPNNRRETRAYHVKGAPVPFGRILLTCGTMPTDALLAKAGEYGVTLGVFLNGLLVWSIHQHQLAERSARRRAQPVKICVPINLRSFFPSDTVRNFSAFFNPGIDSRLGEYSPEEIFAQLSHYMGQHVNAKELASWMAYNVGAEQNPVVRVMPLFIKKLALMVAFRLQGDNYSSTTLSNFGLVRLPADMAAHVNRIDFFLGRAAKRRCQATAVSFGGRTFIDFSRTYAEADIERRFFAKLVALGVPVEVESNGDANVNAETAGQRRIIDAASGGEGGE